MKVAILGLGYVGLPVACLLAEKGFDVYGVDLKQETVSKINSGVSPIDDEDLNRDVAAFRGKIKATTDASVISDVDVILVCVPTPVDAKYNPDFVPLMEASESIAKYLKKGQLVILESTVSPGTCEEVMLPVLEKSGLISGKDFYLAHCPERVDPGNKKYKLRNLPRCVGALSEEGLSKAALFYRSFIEAEIAEISSLKAAEATKIVENSFRDINIAFINEIAKSFDRMGIDIIEVIKGASTKFTFWPHYPGCGVGGHCISVDPYYLIEKGKGVGFDHKFLKIAREVNNSMPGYTISRLMSALNSIGKSVKGTKITVLGIAYKPDVDDHRESPALKIISALKSLGADLRVYDPWLLDQSTVNNLDDALNSEVLVLCTAHTEFKEMNLNQLKEKNVKIIIDGRNCLDKNKIRGYGIIYKGIGR